MKNRLLVTALTIMVAVSMLIAPGSMAFAEAGGQDVVAKVGTEGYASLKEALEKADGGTVTLEKDVTVDGTIAIQGKSFTLDMQGHTISGNGSDGVLDFLNCDAVMKNGTVTKGGGHLGAIASRDGKLECYNVNASNSTYGIQAFRSIAPSDGGTLVVKGGEFTENEIYALRVVCVTATVEDVKIHHNGGAISYGGTIGGEGMTVRNAIITENNDVRGAGVVSITNNDPTPFVMENSVISGNTSKMYVVHNEHFDNDAITGKDYAMGTTTFRNVAITNNVSTEDSVFELRSGNLNLAGVTIATNKSKESTLHMSFDPGDVELTNTIIRENISEGGYYYSSGGISAVYGMLFLRSGAIYDNKVQRSTDTSNDLYVGMGARISMINAALMEDGSKDFSNYKYIDSNSAGDPESVPATNTAARRYYTVSPEPVADMVIATIGDKEYKTLGEAIEEAKDGDTVKIVLRRGDAEVGSLANVEQFKISKSLTFDLNGKNISSRYGPYGGIFVAKDGATITVKDSSENKTAVVDGAMWADGGKMIVEDDLKGCTFSNKKGTLEINKIQKRLNVVLEKGETVTLGKDYESQNKPDYRFEIGFVNAGAIDLNEITGDKTMEDLPVADGPGATDFMKNILEIELLDNGEIVKVRRDGTIYLHKFGKAVYLNGVNGDDSKDGMSKENAVKTFERAKEILADTKEAECIFVTGSITVSGDEKWSLPDDRPLARHTDLKGRMVKVTGKLETSDMVFDGSGIAADTGLIFVSGDMEMKEGTVVRGANCYQTSSVYADGVGGGVYVKEGTLTVDGAVIENNMAVMGGGIGVVYQGKVHIKKGTIRGNSAMLGLQGVAYQMPSGGGVFVGTSSDLLIDDCEIVENYAAFSGGGIALGTGGNSAMTNNLSSTKTNNLVMNGGKINKNTARASGGGILVQAYGDARIYGGELCDNTAKGEIGYAFYNGGAIYVNDNGNLKGFPYGSLYIESVEISDNTAESAGGGIAGCPTSHVIVELKNGSVIYENKAGRADDIFLSSTVGLVNYMPLQVVQSSAMFKSSISQYMLNGAKYNWLDEDGNKLTKEQLTDIVDLEAHNDLTAANKEVKESVKMAKVKMTGNTSASSGGAIGANGNVYIGEEGGVPKEEPKEEPKHEESSEEVTVNEEPPVIEGETVTEKPEVHKSEPPVSNGEMTVEGTPYKTAPPANTGDETQILMWLILIAATGTLAGAILYRKRKGRE